MCPLAGPLKLLKSIKIRIFDDFKVLHFKNGTAHTKIAIFKTYTGPFCEMATCGRRQGQHLQTPSFRSGCRIRWGSGHLVPCLGAYTKPAFFFTEARAHIEQGTCEKVRIDVSKVCAHRAHITCMPRAYRVHAACRPRAYHMHIPCIPCAYHMCTKCIPHAYHVDTTWIPRVYQNIPRAYCVHTTSTPRACHVRAACIPNAYHVHTTRIHLTCTVCTRYTPTAYHMHTTCTPSRSTSTIDHLAEGIA